MRLSGRWRPWHEEVSPARLRLVRAGRAAQTDDDEVREDHPARSAQLILIVK